MSVSASTIIRVRFSDLAVLKGEDAIHDQLQRLLFTRPGEQIGFLQRGCRLLDYFDEPATSTTCTAALDEVCACIDAYMPQITLTQAQVSSTGNEIEIALEYEYQGHVYRDALTFPLK